jgi:Peptidase M10 serralysin C terminal/RTX calcium-binding nonapeptide repeat (4 copies)
VDLSKNQIWSIASGEMFLEDSKPSKEDPKGDQRDITNVQYLNDQQAAQVSEAFGLWDDVSGFTPAWVPDDANLARDATTWVTESFLGIPTDAHYKASFSGNWTRVAMGTISGGTVLGINKPDGAAGHYREIYINADKVDGEESFRPDSQAFSVLVHEIGHSVLDFLPELPDGVGKHIVGSEIDAIMNPTSAPDGWYPSTPMSWDIDAAISHYGAATTRTGDDTYGFNAHFSGEYRFALDFKFNTKPLITIYDSAGIDTLDASGFRYSTHIDLMPGAESWLRDYPGDGINQTFAVIYQGFNAEAITTWIENAVGGGGDDEIFGNALRNHLYGGDGKDILNGREDADIMEGGAGDDSYTVDDAGDQVLDVAGEEGGHDTIYTKLNSYDMRAWDKGQAVEELTFTGIGTFTGHGNHLKNAIIGGSGADWLYGHGDNDILVGGKGWDILSGDEGDDTLFGGNGDDDIDMLVGGTGDDQYLVFDGHDQVMEVAGDEGGLHDTIHTMVASYALWEGVEDLVFEDDSEPTEHFGYGTDRDNRITGSGDIDLLYGFGGNDTLDGRAGADFMLGGVGNDTYIVDNVGDVVSEKEMGPDGFFRDTGGTDEIRTNLTAYTLGDAPDSVVENLAYTAVPEPPPSPKGSSCRW